MTRAIWTILLTCSLSVCARAETRVLGLYLKHSDRLPAESARMMRSEMKRLFAPAGISVIWKDFEDRQSGEDFDFVAVGSIEDSCAPAEVDLPVAAASQMRLSLADSFLSANQVLPFFEVDCPRLARMLGGEGGAPMLGRALARVMAHELYHIVALTKSHRGTGISKAAFSVDDLIRSDMDFDVCSLARLSKHKRFPKIS